MPEIPDLSKLNGEAKAAPEAPQVYRTAFMVLVDAVGNIQVSTDLGENVVIDHPPTHDEIWSACQLINKDVEVQQIAGRVQAAILQMGSAMQQQAMNEQLKQRLNLK